MRNCRLRVCRVCCHKGVLQYSKPLWQHAASTRRNGAGDAAPIAQRTPRSPQSPVAKLMPMSIQPPNSAAQCLTSMAFVTPLCNSAKSRPQRRLAAPVASGDCSRHVVCLRTLYMGNRDRSFRYTLCLAVCCHSMGTPRVLEFKQVALLSVVVQTKNGCVCPHV